MSKCNVYCRPWNGIYKRKINGEEKILLLWSSVPDWIIGDHELLLLLNTFVDGCTVEDAIEKLSSEINKPKDKLAQEIKATVEYLIKEGLMYFEGQQPPEPLKGDERIRDVIVHPTNRCNLRCTYCCNTHNVVPKEKEVSIDVLKDFLNQVRELTIDKPRLSIIGGEPLLEREKVFELTKHARAIGFGTVGVSTNGTLIDRAFAKKAKELDIDVQVSIDGVTAEINDKFRGKGTYDKIIRAIKILKEENVFVVTNYTVTSDNFYTLERYFELALELGVDQARFGPMKRIGSGTECNDLCVPVNILLSHAYRLFLRRPEFIPLLGKDYFSAFAQSCRLKVKYGYCGTGMVTVLLNPDGSIYPCTGHALPEFKLGNIQETSFKKIWTTHPILQKIRTTYPVDNINEKCATCNVRYWCMGSCRAEAYHCTKTMNASAIECENIKKAIIEMIWILGTDPHVVKEGDLIFH